jgi:hypothetical protein
MPADVSEPKLRGLEGSVSNCKGDAWCLAKPQVQELEVVIIKFQNLFTTKSDRYGYT